MFYELVAINYKDNEIDFAETVGMASCLEVAMQDARDFLLAEPDYDTVEFIERVSNGINKRWIPLQEGMVV